MGGGDWRWTIWWFYFLKRKVWGCIRPSYGPFRPLNWLKLREI